MAITVSQFRTDFTEFANTTNYPDALINLWLGVAAARLTGPNWGTLLDIGTELFVAHYVSLAYRNRQTAAVGGIPGAQQGPVSSSQAEISVSYDIHASTLEGEGHWNLTVYGTQFMELVKIVGVAVIQIMPNNPIAGTALFAGVPFWFGGGGN